MAFKIIGTKGDGKLADTSIKKKTPAKPRPKPAVRPSLADEKRMKQGEVSQTPTVTTEPKRKRAGSPFRIIGDTLKK